MTSPGNPGDLESLPGAILDEESKGLPVVWLLPLVALLVGGWLFYQTMSEKGPVIEISFETAEGIEKGKTAVKFRELTVGKIMDMDFSEDLKSVVLTAEMENGTEPFMTDASRFWVVRPRIGTAGISGLSTLFSGAYIAFEPDNSGTKQKSFVGLDQPPIVPIDKEGSRYKLRAERLGSLAIGAPVYFRQLDVGEVTDYKLADDYRYVDIGIFIEAPYSDYVREGTQFWNAGGISMAMDASGIKVEMESLVALLSGGIAFDTRPETHGTPLAKEGHVFSLHQNRAKSLERPITEVVTYALRFRGTVRGLSIGAPVEYRGIHVGTVKDIMFGSDPEHEGVSSPVVIIDIEPQRTMDFGEIDQASRDEREQYDDDPEALIDGLVNKGLRARLQTGNLVTGALFVDLDIYPDANPEKVTQNGLYPEIPTLPSSMQSMIANVNRILTKVAQSDLQGTLTNLNELIVSTNKLVSALEYKAPELAREFQTTLQSADRALRTLERNAAGDGEIGSRVQDALKETAAAARAIRVMAEFLERHPEAILSGKSGNP